MTVHPPREQELTLEPVSSVIRNAVHRFDKSAVRSFVATAQAKAPGMSRFGAVSAATPAVSVVGGGSLVIFRTSEAVEEDLDSTHPAAALADIRRQLEGGEFPQIAPGLLEAADAAVARLRTRQGENIEAWATRLAQDVSRPND